MNEYTREHLRKDIAYCFAWQLGRVLRFVDPTLTHGVTNVHWENDSSGLTERICVNDHYRATYSAIELERCPIDREAWVLDTLVLPLILPYGF